jgi:hypothetical protein
MNHQNNNKISRFTKLCAGLCSITSLVLVSVWASVDQENYLQKASWQHNLFAWHPVLMVAGFYFSQTIAILSWGWPILDVGILQGGSLLCSLRKLSHVIWQTTAFTTLILALYAIFKTKHTQSVTNLSSMHSWVGITVASAFAFNYLGGILFEGIKWVAKSRSTMEGLVSQVRSLHKTIGLLTYAVSAMAVLSGISVFQGHSCQQVVSSPDWNPAAHYTTMSTGCKVANGLGISVLATMILVFLSVVAHYKVVDLSAMGAVIDGEDDERNGLNSGQDVGHSKAERMNAQGNGNKYKFCFDGGEQDAAQSGVGQGGVGRQIPQSYQRPQNQPQ